ncbi:uncharacterized protein AB675_10794 [Cyphellophora attinorum]|uniref:Uncharacterized protein n=1 Tax=Cyphellophora attinorum TaxID=1664694 RepID=A0A0N1HAE2_9EURO|nr:uncharacterized protein AB675_10794 [Phialophora attinorum]KPI40795.1 hypothetical protein AB675_10794 [Phialophora attinorum]
MSYADPARVPENHRDHNDPSVPFEPTGAVTKDSLAAESLEQHGEFEKNPKAHVLGVEGGKSTLANTDTSGASALPPSSSGAARDGDETTKYPDADAGKADGTTTSEGNYYGGASAGKISSGYDTSNVQTSDYGGDNRGQKEQQAETIKSSQGQSGASGSGSSGATETAALRRSCRRRLSSRLSRKAVAVVLAPERAAAVVAVLQKETVQQSQSASSSSGAGASASASSGVGADTTSSSGPSAGTGIRPHVDAAPNYAARVSGAIPAEGDDPTYKPKGTNLTEGGDIPENVKTFTGNVGGAKDPGRLAEQNFEAINANVAGGGLGRDKEGTTDVGGQYGVLGSEKLQ